MMSKTQSRSDRLEMIVKLIGEDGDIGVLNTMRILINTTYLPVLVDGEEQPEIDVEETSNGCFRLKLFSYFDDEEGYGIFEVEFFAKEFQRVADAYMALAKVARFFCALRTGEGSDDSLPVISRQELREVLPLIV